MTYPVLDENFRPGARWDRRILVFNRKEMVHLLSNVKTKAGKQERFFSFGFSASDQEIYGARGFAHLGHPAYSKNLLQNKLKEMKAKLKNGANI